MTHAIQSYLQIMADRQATDMYITVNRPVMLRCEDALSPVEPDVIMSLQDIIAIVKSMLDGKRYQEFEVHHEANLSFGVPGLGRFRVNILQQRQTPSLVIRAIRCEIPEFESLGLPLSLKKLVEAKRGIVLVCGMTGSGKSTTLASLIDHRNRTQAGHIITIEDPVEYLHEHKKSLVTQREIGIDTENYHIALKNSFRQRPDVIMVGEIRDAYVMEQALVAAETGHLCLSTIHANNAYQAIERILNFFDEHRLQQARLNLAMNLRGIVAQRLVPARNGKRVLAYEVMLNEGYVRELILKGETAKIREVMAQNKSNGMVTFDQTLLELHTKGVIDEAVAIAEADMPVDMELQIRKLKNASAFQTAFNS